MALSSTAAAASLLIPKRPPSPSIPILPPPPVTTTHSRHHHRPLFHCQSLSLSSSSPDPSASFDLRLYWTELISQINAELDAAVPVRYPDRIYEAMRYSVLSPGAKRAAPVMCVAAACDLLGAPLAAAFPTACALEMVHAASLIHDDLPCVDAAQLRRGRPTNHAVFGSDMAILAGDALFPLAYSHIVAKTPTELVPEAAILRVIDEIARTVGSTGMAAGQFLDLIERDGGGADVMTVLKKKFGEMAECSAVCGGVLGGAEGEVLESLRRYGRAVGVLYQVVDDILMEDNGGGGGGGGKMRSNASVVRVYGMEKAMEIAEELREKAKAALAALAERYGKERVLTLYSFVDYAVERGFEVTGAEAELARKGSSK